MKGNRVLVGVTLWLVAVASVAGLAWFAIDSAGRSVTALPISPSGVSEQLDPPSDPGLTADPPVLTPTASAASPTPSVSSSGVDTGDSSSLSSTSTSTSSSTGGNPRPSTSSPRPTPKPTTSAPRQRILTQSGYWGSATISCVGAKVTLRSATPANNWQVNEPTQPIGAEVEVEFHGTDGGEVHVKGRCLSGGRPDLDVQTSGGDK
jgi:hypothetical protein